MSFVAETNEIKHRTQDLHTFFWQIEDAGKDDKMISIARELKIPLLLLQKSSEQCGIFTLQMIDSESATPMPPMYNEIQNEKVGPAEACMVLHTSGTGGKKKIVPYTLDTVICGAAAIIQSWKLTKDDVNLNMMPLFHIGGIARNVLAVTFSGGGVVCAPGFDPSLFWDIGATGRASWYYASPTMHQMVPANSLSCAHSHTNAYPHSELEEINRANILARVILRVFFK